MEMTLQRTYVRVLSIAGSDSGGGAGIQADLKTFAALGCFGMTAITAITAQNTVGVAAIHGVPPEMVKAQIDAVVGDIGVDAIKIGMLLSADIVQAVADALRQLDPRPPIVLDPVMVATSGDRLLAPDTVEVMVRELFPLATVVTPNLDEAVLLLLQRPIASAEALLDAAVDLVGLGAPTVLVKGGHLEGDEVTDVFAAADGRTQVFRAPRIQSSNVHGTGCTLSSAIAAYLAMGRPLTAAIKLGRSFVREAIAAGAEVTTGHGHGPLNHGYAPEAMRVLGGQVEAQ